MLFLLSSICSFFLFFDFSLFLRSFYSCRCLTIWEQIVKKKEEWSIFSSWLNFSFYFKKTFYTYIHFDIFILCLYVLEVIITIIIKIKRITKSLSCQITIYSVLVKVPVLESKARRNTSDLICFVVKVSLFVFDWFLCYYLNSGF